MLRSLIASARALLHPANRNTQIQEELGSFFESSVDDKMRRGMSAEEARRAACAEIGSREMVRHKVWSAGWESVVESLARDTLVALRQLKASPSFAAAAILTLALGIGANAAIFTLVDSLLLRPLPVEHPGQLAVLAFRQGQGPLSIQFAVPDLRDLRAETSQTFSGMLGYLDALDGLSRNGKAERIYTNYVTGDYFSVLGVQPYLGRLILPSEGRTSGADPILVLSYSCWKTRFAGDRSLIGSRLLLNGHPVTVIGVTPPGFHGVRALADVEGYIPFNMLTTYEYGWPNDLLDDRVLRNFKVLGRLKPGVSLSNAAAALNVVAHRLSAEYPSTDRGLVLSVYPERFARPDPESSPTLIRAAILFLVLVILVLLLACANIANLLLVRATGRERELALRMALGAGRGRLIRQLLTESLVLACLGGIAGIALGFACTRAIASVQLHTFAPVQLDIPLDWRIFAYSLGAVLLTGIVVGLAPAVRACHRQAGEVLHRSGRTVTGGRNPLRSSLVVLQVAGSLTLLVIAALFIESLAHVQDAPLGFDPHQVVNFAMDPAEAGYGEPQGLAFYKTLLDRVQALPGVQSAGLASSTPMNDYWLDDNLRIADYQNPPGQPLPLVLYSIVSPGLFPTLRIPIVRGRSFTDTDGKSAPDVAIVNEAFASRYWPGRNPIGEHFAKVSGITNPEYEVVGVAANSHFSSLTGPVAPYFYLPLARNYALSSLMVLEVRSSEPSGATIREVEGIVHQLTPSLPLFNVQTMTESLDTPSAFLLFRFGAAAAAALGALGLILALVGVYGVIAYSVSQRTREIGIRVALGAQSGQILRMLFVQGAVIIVAGVVVGCAGALIAGRLISAFLVGVGFADPLTYLGAAFMLALVALAACYIPARRATRIDPTTALRCE